MANLKEGKLTPPGGKRLGSVQLGGGIGCWDTW